MPVEIYYRPSMEIEELLTLRSKMDRLKRLNLDVILSMQNPKAALRASHNLSLETASTNASDYVPKLASGVHDAAALCM